jgi:hypothetical protein
VVPQFGQPFEASRDVHTIAKNVIVVDDVVTLADADGNSMRRLADRCVLLGSAPLDSDRAQPIGSMTFETRSGGRRRVFFIRPGAIWSRVDHFVKDV